MGNLKDKLQNKINKNLNKVNLARISGNLSDSDKSKLLSGDGFVKVPTEELRQQRIDVYHSLM